MKKLFTTTKIGWFVLTFVSSSILNASTYTSVMTGNFNSAATWGVASIPAGTHDFIISPTHTVTLTAPATVFSLTIQAGAIFNNGANKLTMGVFGGTYYTNNGIHNGTGDIYYFNGGASGMNGSGVINCDIEIQGGGSRFEVGSTLTINGNIFATLGGNLNLENYGDLTINGDITCSLASGYILNASGGKIKLNGNLILYASAWVENHGDFTISNVLTLGDQQSLFYNAANVTIGGDVLGTGGAGFSSFVQGQNSVAKFGGAVFPSGFDGDLLVVGTDVLFGGTTEPNTVEYNGGANQVIKNPMDNPGYGYTNNTYSNLIVSNSAIKTLESNTAINGDLTLRGTSQMDVSASNYSIDLQGNFTDSSTNANPYVERSGNFNFMGTAAQSITSLVSGGQTFYNLKINNSSATGVTLLNNNITVSNILDLSDGILYTGTYECAVTNTALAAITGYSTASYVDKNLRRSLLAGGGSYNFPIGNTNSYQLATLNISAGHSIGTLLGTFSNSSGITGLPLVESGNTYNSLLHPGGTAPGTDHATAGIWTFTPNSGTATYDLTLNARNYSYGDIGTNTIAKRANSGAAWTILGTVGSSSGSDPFVVSRTAYSGFSDFAILSAIVPLPIELSAISAKCEQSKTSNNQYGATIQWTTATEKNSDYFIIEGSKNGVDWEKLDAIDGSGTKYEPTNYYYHDDFINPTPENETVVYYRVSQTDFDGVVNTYDILSCKCEASNKIKIHPVPATQYIIINFGDQNNVPNSFQIIDMFGHKIEEITIGGKEGNTSYKLDITNYASGRYIIKINDWKLKEDAVFIKK